MKDTAFSTEDVPTRLAEYSISDGDSLASDTAVLAALGYKQEFKRDFSFIGLWSLVSSELAVLPGVAGTIWCVVLSILLLFARLIMRRYTMGYW